MTEAIFLFTYFADLLLIGVCWRLDWKAMGFAVVANMLLIPIMAGKMITLFGVTSNITNLCYSAVFFGVSLCGAKYCFKDSMRLVQAIFITLIAFTTLGNILVHCPAIPGNEQKSAELLKLLTPSAQILTAALLAFYVSTSFNLFCLSNTSYDWRHLKLFQRKLIGNVGGQFLDSFLFFPIAFYGKMSLSQSFLLALGGFIIKATLNIIDTPLYLLFTYPKKVEANEIRLVANS